MMASMAVSSSVSVWPGRGVTTTENSPTSSFEPW